ncbi:MAG: FAD-dependent oxidoreductase [Vampirovibrionia bacterium]
MVEMKKNISLEESIEGYTEQQAIAESSRCLMCDDSPCQSDCPAGVRVPEFLRKIRTGDFLGAARIVREDNVFGASCARICPSDVLCQSHCSNIELDTPVDIPGLQKFVCDYQQKLGLGKIKPEKELSQKIAVIGAGPGGLGAAFELRKEGYQVTVFETTSFAGGLLRSGIPSYRLPRQVLDAEIDFIKDYGVDIKCNQDIKSLSELKKEYDAIYISVGLQKEKIVNIPGNDLPGVYYALDFLKQQYIDGNVNLGKNVAVIGGGDVAMDCARTSVRMPGVENVYIVYRRSVTQMPAQADEIDDAQKEGIIFNNLLAPYAIEGSGKVDKLICNQVRLGEPDDSGRRKPIVIEDSRVEFQVDNVIFAIGQEADKDFYQANTDLKLTKWGTIEVNTDTFETSVSGVYAGGDVVGGMTAVEAIGNGKKAACAIHKNLSKGN